MFTFSSFNSVKCHFVQIRPWVAFRFLKRESIPRFTTDAFLTLSLITTVCLSFHLSGKTSPKSHQNLVGPLTSRRGQNLLMHPIDFKITVMDKLKFTDYVTKSGATNF